MLSNDAALVLLPVLFVLSLPFFTSKALFHFLRHGFSLHLSTLMIVIFVASLLVLINVMKVPGVLGLITGHEFGFPFPFYHDETFQPYFSRASEPWSAVIAAIDFGFGLATLLSVAGILERRILERAHERNLQQRLGAAKLRGSASEHTKDDSPAS